MGERSRKGGTGVKDGNLCPECSGPVVTDYRSGDIECSECGLVLEERMIDDHSEWRTFTNEAHGGMGRDPNRVGGPSNPLLRDGGLSTSIARGAGSGTLAKWHDRASLNGSDRSLLDAFRKISELAEKMQLPATISIRAKELFKQIEEAKSLRGRSADAIIAAALYIACRQEEVPRTIKELKLYTGIDKKEIGKCYRFMMRTLGTPLNTIKTSDFMSRFCSMLRLPLHITTAATEVAKEAVRIGVVAGKSPVSVAAAAIYLASQLSSTIRNVKEISMVTGVSEVTIRSAYKDLYHARLEVVPAGYATREAIDDLPL